MHGSFLFSIPESTPIAFEPHIYQQGEECSVQIGKQHLLKMRCQISEKCIPSFINASLECMVSQLFNSDEAVSVEEDLIQKKILKIVNCHKELCLMTRLQVQEIFKNFKRAELSIRFFTQELIQRTKRLYFDRTIQKCHHYKKLLSLSLRVETHHRIAQYTSQVELPSMSEDSDVETKEADMNE